MKNLMRNLFSLALVAALVLGSGASTAGAFSNPAPAPRGPVSLAQLGLAPQPVWLRYDPQAKSVNVPPPAQYFQPHPQSATFNITYIAAGGRDPFGDTCLEFPNEAKTAFTTAANYWGSLLTSAVPISIQACWAPLGENILGGSASLNAMGNFTHAPVWNTWYPVALANALEGSDQDTLRDDMAIVYSSNFASNFYYGAPPVPFDKIDFTTVVMHEIGHGLGFAGSMNICSGKGNWGYWSVCPPTGTPYPESYDRFAVDASGHALIDPAYYANKSPELAVALTNNNVYFTGENARAANGGGNVKLYAPSSWAPGSSYSHLDYLTYLISNNNLMVYAIGPGYAVHDPGPVGMGLLKDVGWAPFAPSALTVTTPVNNQVNLSWTSNSINQEGFKVERSPNGSTDWAQIGTSVTTTYIDGSLPPGSHYFYRVRAYHSLGDSLYSNVADAWPTSILMAPGGLTASASAPRQVDLAWTDLNTNETNYQVYRSPGGAGSYLPLTELPANSNSYSDASVNPGVAYDYEVRATNSGGSPGPSQWSYASAVTPLNPPGSLAVTGEVLPGQVTLGWQDSNDNESGYRAESSPTGAAPWAAMCTAPANATGCSGTGLMEGMHYYFRVRAYNSVAESAVVTTSQVTPLIAPAHLAAAVVSPTRANLSWDDANRTESGYTVQRSLDGASEWTTIGVTGPNATWYSDGSFEPGTPCFYRVFAANDIAISGFSAVVQARLDTSWVYLPLIR